ncbi:MAG: hypothetical protein NTW79_01795 [Candidatus Berkelbacteria bacterium]|nr:hypothetical protein [Candidatus Berkelbacteria bacterium]
MSNPVDSDSIRRRMDDNEFGSLIDDIIGAPTLSPPPNYLKPAFWKHKSFQLFIDELDDRIRNDKIEGPDCQALKNWLLTGKPLTSSAR